MDRTFSRPFCPNLRFCFACVDMLGLRACSDDLNVVLFEFLEDDTKLAQSCVHWLYVQHWYTVVPESSMRVTEVCDTILLSSQLLPMFSGKTFVFRVVLSDNFECSFAFVEVFSDNFRCVCCLCFSSNLRCSVVLLNDDSALELGRCRTHVEGRVRRRCARAGRRCARAGASPLW